MPTTKLDVSLETILFSILNGPAFRQMDIDEKFSELVCSHSLIRVYQWIYAGVVTVIWSLH